MFNHTPTDTAQTPFATAEIGEFINQIAEKTANAGIESEFDPNAVALPQTTEDVQKAQVEAAAKAEENLYECHHLTGKAKHPGKIVETPGLANIKPPRPTHRPRLPKNLIESGEVSEIQLERIIYAGQAHSQRLLCDWGARRNLNRRRDGSRQNNHALRHYPRQLVCRQKKNGLVQRQIRFNQSRQGRDAAARNKHPDSTR